MLKVKKKSKSTKSTEHAFEHKFATALGKAGRVSYHTTEQYIAGIPDRYVCGGIWIEFKAIVYKRSVTPGRYLSPEQKLWLTRLERGGDKCYVCILFMPENGERRIMLMPWSVFKEFGSMSHADIVTNTHAMDWIETLARQL